MNIEQRPAWEDTVVGFLLATEHGAVAEIEIIPKMGRICTELLRRQQLTDLGILQRFLRQKRSGVQLIAKPFDPEEYCDSIVKCVDVISFESRGHLLHVAVGLDEAKEQLEKLGRTHKVNEAALSLDTGIVVYLDQ